jgi:GTP-binding protein
LLKPFIALPKFKEIHFVIRFSIKMKKHWHTNQNPEKSPIFARFFKNNKNYMGNIVAIVGRPNVGKSTLYNRLVGGREAIVDDFAGVTRDRKYGYSEWNGKKFTVVDTGGFVSGSEDIFEAAIRSQVQVAIEEASVIVFMVDAATGLTEYDEDIAKMLRRTTKPVFLTVNKVDNPERMLDANEFWSLAFEEVFFVMAVSGSGTGELLDAITEKIENEEPLPEDLPKIAIVGQPNVGKSSLVNALLGEERNIVTDIAGTTRDSIHSRYTKFGKDFLLIDTAGMRRKAKVSEDLEFYSVMRAINVIDECDVVMLVIDATLGIESQDLTIFRLAIERKKGIMILVNKWDLMAKETNTARDYEAVIVERLKPFSDVPVVFVSALEKQRIFKAVEVALEIFDNRRQRIKTSVLNEFLEEATTKYAAPAHRGHLIKIKYMTQLPLYYPAFALFSNHSKHLPENYRKYIENEMRKKFNFKGVPIALVFKDK